MLLHFRHAIECVGNFGRQIDKGPLVVGGHPIAVEVGPNRIGQGFRPSNGIAGALLGREGKCRSGMLKDRRLLAQRLAGDDQIALGLTVVIIGDDEANAGEVTLKPLRSNGEAQNEQKRISVDQLADEIMNSFLDWEEE